MFGREFSIPELQEKSTNESIRNIVVAIRFIILVLLKCQVIFSQGKSVFNAAQKLYILFLKTKNTVQEIQLFDLAEMQRTLLAIIRNKIS
jgi:hypothetical protein